MKIYWAPINTFKIPVSPPVSVFKDLVSGKTEESKNESFFSCPSAFSRLKSTYVFKNPVTASFKYLRDSDLSYSVVSTNANPIPADIIRTSSLTSGPSIYYKLGFIFFAEEPTMAYFNSPYFHEPKHLHYGSLVPGAYDIGRWFRPYNCEFQMWRTSGDLVIKNDEPLFYMEVDKQSVEFVEFEFTEEIWQIIEHLKQYSKSKEVPLTLEDRYLIFETENLKEQVLSIIKQNLV